MADASNLQTSFLGGAVTAAYQGRADTKKYAEGMNVCFNSLPIETGAWVRRPGTRIAALTRSGVYGRVVTFDFAAASPYTIEFTAGHIRFFSGYSLVHTYDPQIVTSISTANPAVVTLNANVPASWANADQVEFSISGVNLAPETGALLQGRQFTMGSKSGATFALFDTVTGAGIDGSTLNVTAGTPIQVQHILDLATSYSSAMIPNIRPIQAQNNNAPVMVLLHQSIAPNVISSNNPPNPVFAINAASFTDGPYLDVPTDGSTLTPSAATVGSITVTSSTAQFAASDVGRHVRLFSQPANWAVGTAYTAGQNVTYNGGYYVALVNNTGNIPGADSINWAAATNVAQWGWGIITAFGSATSVTVNLKTPLVNTLATATYRLGTYSGTTGWPTTGCYHEGRLWLSGYLGNHIDGSAVGQPGGIFNFSPTAADGSVSDANAISYTFNFKDINAIFWMSPQQTGILCGTQAGEVLVQASSNTDVLTPTSIQAKKITRYGSANIEPVDAPFATLFVERNNRKVLEYLADVFTGKYTGMNVSLTGSQFIKSGVAEIKYQRELCPVAWVRNNDGTLAGMTYRRESPMLSEQPAFAGWHNHTLGTNRSVASIAVGPSVGGNLDTLTMVTLDPSDSLYRVELMTDIFPENGANTDAWFVDGGTTPAGAVISGSTLTIYGLHNYEGKVVSLWLAGIDAGDYTVTNGQISVALPAGFNNSRLLTQASIAAVNGVASFEPMQMPVTYNIQSFPSNPQSIQSYIGPTTPVTGVDPSTILLDYAKSRLFEFSNGSADPAGIRVFDIMSGLQTNQATYSQIFGQGVTASSITTPYAIGYDGRLYMPIAGSNSVKYVKIDPDKLLILDSAGQNNSNSPQGPVNINLATTLAPVRVGGKSFLLAPSVLTSQKTLNVIETTDGSMQNACHTFVFDEFTGFSSPTFDGSGVGYSVSSTSTVIGVYQTVISPAASGYDTSKFPATPNPYIATTKLGTIAVASIDATWTSMSGVSSFCYDNSDGHLLLMVQTNNSVTNKSYLLKVNSSTAAIMWALPVASWPSFQKWGMPNSYAAYGTFDFFAVDGSGQRYYHVNTIAGTATVTNIGSIFSSINTSTFDARLGGVFFNASFLQSGGSPVLLNSTPSSFSQQFGRLLLSAATTPATGRQFYIVPAAVGVTYTSQGQRLRAIGPQESGARNGPALGKNRRTHRQSLLLNSTAGIYFGTDFTKMHLAKLTSKPSNPTPLAANVLFSGVFSGTFEDNDTYDSMQAWQVVRPYPANVLAASAHLETTDR